MNRAIPPRLARLALAGVLCAAGAGCVDKATVLQGQDLAQLRFQPASRTEGIFPDVSVTGDPQNPFALVSGYALDAVHNPDPLQFQVQALGAPVAGFYVWATILARATPEGNGEAQFYAGVGLRDTYFQKQVPLDGEGNPSPALLGLAHDMAVDAFTTVLTQFPDAVTYDATGTQKYELVTQSLQSILALGELAPSGWILVTDSTGMPRAVKQ